VKNIECDILLFADDTAIVEPLTEGNLSIMKINRDLETLSSWASRCLVKFNPTKTKYLIFSKKMRQQQYEPLLLQNKELQQAGTHKHLGLTLNSRLTWDDHINRICQDAGKRLSTIKRLPHNISPHTKIHIYCTFIRPLLEYASVVFDNCSAALSDQLESVQRQAALAATRAYRHTSTNNLFQECGLATLKNRRTTAKLVLFYKIRSNITPNYLRDILPDQTARQANYNLRYSQDIRLPKIQKNYFLKSYIPSSIKLWNKLAENVRAVADVDAFKIHLQQIYGKIELYKPYLLGMTMGHIHLSRIRMGLSGLNSHRKKYHFIPDSSCPTCMAPVENEEHFFLLCASYAAQRQGLMAQIKQILPNKSSEIDHLESKTNRNKMLGVLIRGTNNHEIDMKLFSYTAKYVENTHRFDRNDN